MDAGTGWIRLPIQTGKLSLRNPDLETLVCEEELVTGNCIQVRFQRADEMMNIRERAIGVPGESLRNAIIRQV